jgi:hypothetical protein
VVAAVVEPDTATQLRARITGYLIRHHRIAPMTWITIGTIADEIGSEWNDVNYALQVLEERWAGSATPWRLERGGWPMVSVRMVRR